jgi:WbqC-like protein family
VKLGIMQPYLFPYIGYFQLLNAVDRFVVYDDVAFIKQGWVNRNRILINDHPAYFTVPVKHASSFSLIRDTLVDDDRQHARWVEKTLTTFSNAYRRAPEFARVFPVVEAVFTRHTNRVADLAVASLKAVAELLDIRVEWVESSAQYGNTHFKGEDRVLAICRAESATEYINAAGGRELYARDRFEAAGLCLRFIQSVPIEYRQFSGPFVPSLSIIDVLMFNPLDRVRSFLDACEVA